MSAREVEKLRNFLLRNGLNRAFDYRVLGRAANLNYGDPQLLVKLNDVLEELRSKGDISWFVLTGKTYWIQR